ncbi:DUF2975 domain-containing protein [uncultured Lacinutrix sp.]|uniref:DUF2975 domain-containing protein n=1 Tax=uncultured Lacinutrix sp. TaxID=574032 RepID=UPI00260CADA4|nr:DUF2975 domain-containing protein [uncultured Lacinutrix sp.]
MKTTRTIITVLFISLAIFNIGDIILCTLGLFFNQDVSSAMLPSAVGVSLNIKLLFIFKAIALLIFISAIFILIRKLGLLIKRDFFNLKLINCFLQSGRVFLISGIIGFITSIFELINFVILKDVYGQDYLNIDSKPLYILLMILGLFLIIFSKALNKGRQIQQENDLTI